MHTNSEVSMHLNSRYHYQRERIRARRAVKATAAIPARAKAIPPSAAA